MVDKLKGLGKYSKFLVAALTVVLAGLASVYGDNQYVQLAIGIAGALGVYAVPNRQVK
ncbi:hypothetical protein H0W80_00090 [Candidatus Saccharibacteria bacterium]|nr:hypothetical protein [Candidatus Saccharibacteria bacterium]